MPRVYSPITDTLPTSYMCSDSYVDYKYENTKRTTEQFMKCIEEARDGLAKEIVEYFGVSMNVKKDITTNDIIYKEQIYPKEERIPPKVNKDKDAMMTGLLKYAMLNGLGVGLYGDISAWSFAVIQMAEWYVENVHVYSQQEYVMCPLIKRNVRKDCSGFTTACLWLYGALKDYSYPPSSNVYTFDAKFAETLEKDGFKKLNFSWDTVEPFDIITKDGHVEIYAGEDNGKRKSYGWGSCHDKMHGGLPSTTSHQKSGYTVIWRNKGSLQHSFLNMGNVNTKSAKEVCKACYQTFIKAGCCDGAARGICANIMEESAFNPSICTWDGSAKSGKFGVGGGLCGFYFAGALPDLARSAWGAAGPAKLAAFNEKVKNSGLPYPKVAVHSANTRHIMKTFGGFPFTLAEQLEYLVKVLNNKSYAGVKSITDPSAAALWWERQFERPAKITDRWAKNGNTITKLLS